MTPKYLKANFAFIDQAMVSGSNFINGILLARFLGLTGYGEYVLAYGVILFFLTIQVAFIVSPMMVKGPTVSIEEKLVYFSEIMTQQIFFSSFIALLILIGGFFVGDIFYLDRFEPLVIPLACATFSFLVQDFLRRYFFVVKKPTVALANDILCYGLQMLLIMSFGLSRIIDTSMVLWFMAISFSIANIVAFIQFGKKISLSILDRQHFFKTSRESYNFGKWLFGTNVIYWSQVQFVNYLSAGVLSVEIVGAINASKNVLGALNVFFLGLQNILLPDSSRSYSKEGSEGLNRYLKKVFFWGGALTIFVGLLGSIWSEKWMALLYGKAYAGYGWIVSWWGVYFVISFFQKPLSAGLSVFKKTRSIFFAMTVGFVLFIAAGYLFIVCWKIKGIMFLICVCNLITLAIFFYLYKRAINPKEST